MIINRKIENSNEAVVGIVSAFLIAGLAVIIVSTVQTVYIPQWMEQAEAEHMETVADQFSQLKFSIDTQSAIKQPNTPIASSITLGNKEMPFMMSSRSYGSLDIRSEECTITFIDKDSNSYSYPLNVIKYSSVNTYFLNQEYIYEAGAVILSQSQGSTMSIKPAFFVKYEDNVSVNFTMINISTIGDKKSISGYGTYPLQTEYSTSNPSPIPTERIDDVEYITIETNYPNSWQKFISKTLINSGLKYNTDFIIDTTVNKCSLQFNKNFPTINLRVIKIDAQIAPGWIENVKGG